MEINTNENNVKNIETNEKTNDFIKSICDVFNIFYSHLEIRFKSLDKLTDYSNIIPPMITLDGETSSAAYGSFKLMLLPELVQYIKYNMYEINDVSTCQGDIYEKFSSILNNYGLKFQNANNQSLLFNIDKSTFLNIDSDGDIDLTRYVNLFVFEVFNEEFNSVFMLAIDKNIANEFNEEGYLYNQKNKNIEAVYLNRKYFKINLYTDNKKYNLDYLNVMELDNLLNTCIVRQELDIRSYILEKISNVKKNVNVIYIDTNNKSIEFINNFLSNVIENNLNKTPINVYISNMLDYKNIIFLKNIDAAISRNITVYFYVKNIEIETAEYLNIED